MKIALFTFLATYRRHLLIFGCALLVLSATSLITGCGVPTFLTDLESIIPVASGAVTGLLAIIGSLSGDAALVAVATEIQTIVTKVDAGLAEINTLIESYKKDPNDTLLGNIESGVNEVVADLKTLLTIEGLPSALAVKVQAIVQVIVTQLEALLTVLPVLKGSTAGQAISLVKPVNAATFRSQIHTLLTSK